MNDNIITHYCARCGEPVAAPETPRALVACKICGGVHQAIAREHFATGRHPRYQARLDAAEQKLP